MTAQIPLSYQGVQIAAPVSDLCRHLRAQGQEVTLSDQIRVNVLVMRLGDAKACPETPAQWAQALVPLLARGEAHQSRLHDSIEDWLRGRFPEKARPPSRIRDMSDKPSSQRNKIRLALLVAGIFSLIGLAVLARLTLETGAEVIETASEIDITAGPSGTAGPVVEIDGTQTRLPLGEYIYAILITALPFFTLAIMLSYYLRRPGWLRRQRIARPEARNLDIPDVPTAIFTGTMAQQAFRAFSASKQVPSHRLDVQASVRRTTRSGGFPQIAYAGRSQRREYVIVVEKTGAEDHIALIADPLIEALGLLSAQVTVYEALGGIDQLRHLSGNRAVNRVARLGDVVEEHRGARLLLVGTGASLFDSFRGGLLAAPGFRAPGSGARVFPTLDLPTLLTITPQDRWGQHEALLQKVGFEILPATSEGLHRAARLDNDVPPRAAPARIPMRLDAFLEQLDKDAPRLLSDTPLPQQEAEALVWRLLRYIGAGSGTQMLVALAILGRNFPQLTRYVAGFALRQTQGGTPDGQLPEPVALALARLPWMRQGWMPDWLCREILHQAPPEMVTQQERAMADLIFALDDGGPPEQAARANTLSIGLDLSVAQKLAEAMNLRMNSQSSEGLVERTLRGWGRNRARLRASGRQNPINPLVGFAISACVLGGLYLGFHQAEQKATALQSASFTLVTVFLAEPLPIAALTLLVLLCTMTVTGLAFPRREIFVPWWRVALKLQIWRAKRKLMSQLRGGLASPPARSELDSLLNQAQSPPRVPWAVYLALLMTFVPLIMLPFDDASSLVRFEIGYWAAGCLLAGAWFFHPEKLHLTRVVPQRLYDHPNLSKPPIVLPVLFFAVTLFVTSGASLGNSYFPAGILVSLLIFGGLLFSAQRSGAFTGLTLRMGQRFAAAFFVLSVMTVALLFMVTLLLIEGLPDLVPEGYQIILMSALWIAIAAVNAQAPAYGLHPAHAFSSGPRIWIPRASARLEALCLAGLPLLVFWAVGYIAPDLIDLTVNTGDSAINFALIGLGWAAAFAALLRILLPITSAIARWMDAQFPSLDVLLAAEASAKAAPEPMSSNYSQDARFGSTSTADPMEMSSSVPPETGKRGKT